MRVRSCWPVSASWTCVLAVVASCGGGSAQVQCGPDGAANDAVEVAEVVDAGGADALDADAANDGDARDASDAPEADTPATDAVDARPDADEAPRDVPAAEGGGDALPDLPVEKPPATASWTIAPNPMCTAAGAGCMDTGAVGGYQITASGSCPGASSIQLWFPGGSASVAAGSYAVKPAAGILDVIAMPAGMVGLLAERSDAAAHRYWGRGGTVAVTAVGSARRVSFTGVSLTEEGTAVMTTLNADVTCP